MSDMKKLTTEALEKAVGGATVENGQYKIDGTIVKKELFDEYMRLIMRGKNPNLEELMKKYDVTFPNAKTTEEK